MKTPCPSLLLFALLCVWITPQGFAGETFQKVLNSEAWKTSTADVTIKAIARTKGGYEEENPVESTIFLKRGTSDLVIFHTLINGEPGKRLLKDSEMAVWSDDYSYNFFRLFKSAGDQWEFLCMMHRREFLLIPTAGNAAFLDNNFRIDKVEAEEGQKIKIQLHR